MRRLLSLTGFWLPAVVSTAVGCSFEAKPLLDDGPSTAVDASRSGLADAAAADADGAPTSAVDAGGDTAVVDAGALDAAASEAADAALAALDAAAPALDAAVGAPAADASGVDAAQQADAAPPRVKPPDDPPETFGLVCDGVTCPAVPGTSEQCCTATADIEAKNARAADRCGVVREAAGGCVELEQPGVPDDACPTLTPPGADAAELGCCTSAGMCGTLDTVEGIGCHVDGTLHEQPCGDEDIDPGATCDTAGVFAVLAEVDVAWGGQSGGLFDITDDGRGKVRVWLRLAIDAVAADGSYDGSIQPCGATLPAFYSSLLCESYRPTFPDAIWDDGSVPAVDVQGRYQCDNPGCIFELDAATGLVGIALDDVDGAWPAPDAPLDLTCPAGSGSACYPDHDDDGHPGVTVRLPSDGSAPASSDCRGGYDYRGAPLSANLFAIFDGVRRTDRLHLGVRLRLGGAGRFADDCTLVDGSGVADFVQSRAASCMAEPGSRYFPYGLPAGSNTRCSDSEADFVNDNLPIYDILRRGETPRASLDLADDSPSEGMRFALVRVADAGEAVSCDQVRAAIP